MLYAWVKTALGTLMTANFCVPLVTVVSNRQLWEEPMAVLAGNMSLVSTLYGIVITLIGIYDVAHFQNVSLCRFLQYSAVGGGISFKMAQVCAAVDQFVAVVYPLHHYSIMMRARPWLFGATWLTWVLQNVLGVFAQLFDMTSFSDSVRSRDINSTVAFTGCRWETGLANGHIIVGEAELVTFSLITASLLVYTGVVGHRTKRRLLREHPRLGRNGTSANDNQTFFENYRAFKYIIAVLSLTVSMDIVSPILRISSRWYPRPQLNGFMHQVRVFGFICEGWAYGLLNAKLRAAYKKMLCGRFNRVAASQAMVQSPVRSQRRAATPALHVEDI